jgi:AraC-like DNA-binding protein
MPTVDLGLRAGAAMVLLFLAVLLLRDAFRTRTGRYAAIFVLSALGFAIASAPGLQRAQALWLVPFQIGMFGAPALLWLFSAALFDDGFVLSWRHVAGSAGLAALGFVCPLVEPMIAGPLDTMCSLAFVALALRQAVAGRGEDLVEGRRRFRTVFVVTVGLYVAADILADFAFFRSPASMVVDLVRLAGLNLLTFGFGLSLLGAARDGALLSPGEAPRSVALPSPVQPEPAPADPAESALLAELDRLMARERAYREEGLTIAALAARLGLPEYRLRRLINQRLQYRNFSEFLNGYRLAEAMAALADLAQEEVPVLTIALDAGFGSIGPFNRAFKARTGRTPTEYRRQALAVSEIAQPESGSGEHAAPVALTLASRRS